MLLNAAAFAKGRNSGYAVKLTKNDGTNIERGVYVKNGKKLVVK